jgi:hypothetical protein
MAAEGGRGRFAKRDGKRKASQTPHGVQLAAGVRLIAAGGKHKVAMLVCADGKVQLNEGAVAILRLCDGSRTREQIVIEAAKHSQGRALVADIGEFLDAARARGWIVEVTPAQS